MLSGGATYQAIVGKAEEILRSLGKTDQGNSIRAKDLVSHVRQAIDAGDILATVSDSTIYQYISSASNNDPGCRIESGGAWGGYWLTESDGETPPAEVEEQIVSTPTATIKEHDLYPLMSFWLSSKNYVAKDLSTLKGGGKWGNPDIVGISRTELLGAVEIETASCEVKLSDAAWEQFIFEAISHKRFSNRSWYCYRVDTADQNLPKGMEYYAERYKIGIIQILLTDDDLAKLKANEDPLEFVDRVRERVPAPFEPVSLLEKKALIERTTLTIFLSFD